MDGNGDDGLPAVAVAAEEEENDYAMDPMWQVFNNPLVSSLINLIHFKMYYTQVYF